MSHYITCKRRLKVNPDKSAISHRWWRPYLGFSFTSRRDNPHIHYIVPGGAVSKSDGTWHPSPVSFFAPVRVLSTIFKAKLRDEFRRIGLLQDIDPHVWRENFNGNCQAMGTCQQSIRYPRCPDCGGQLEVRCWIPPLIARIAEYG